MTAGDDAESAKHEDLLDLSRGAERGDIKCIRQALNLYLMEEKGNSDDLRRWMEDFLKHDEFDLKLYVRFLLSSEDESDLTKAFAICLFQSQNGDGWFRRILALMYWYGVGTKTDRMKSREIMNQCSYYTCDFPITPFQILNERLFRCKKVYIWGADENSMMLYCLALQYRLEVVAFVADENKLPFSCQLRVIRRSEVVSGEDSAIISCGYPSDILRNCILFSLEGKREEFDSVLVYNNVDWKHTIVVADDAVAFSNDVFSEAAITNVVPDCPDKESTYVVSMKQYEGTINTLLLKGVPVSNIFMDYTCSCRQYGYVYRAGQNIKTTWMRDVSLYSIIGREFIRHLPKDVTYFTSLGFAIGDQYRPLSRIQHMSRCMGISNPVVIVNENARDLPIIYGYHGIILKKSIYRGFFTYLRTNQLYQNDNFIVLGTRLAYPGISGNSPLLFLPHGKASISKDHIAQMVSVEPYARVDYVNYPEPMIRPADAPDYSGSVLINPYGNWIRTGLWGHEYIELFESIVEILNSNGIKVYTNCHGADQYPIKGTQPVDGTILEMVSVSRMFKAIVCVMTGFIEAMMTTDANIIMVAPNEQTSRKALSKAIGHDNYWEVLFDKGDLEGTASKISGIILGLKPPFCNTYIEYSVSHIVESPDSLEVLASVVEQFPEYRNDATRLMYIDYKPADYESIFQKLEVISGSNPSALFLMACLVADGRVTRDDDFSACSLKRLYETGRHWVWKELYMQMKKYSYDAEALQVLRQALAEGHNEAAYDLSIELRKGVGSICLLDDAIDEIIEIYLSGHIVVASELCEVLQLRKLPEDLVTIREVAEVGHQSGDFRATIWLATCFERGWGVNPDLNRAIDLVRQAYTNNPTQVWIKLVDLLWKTGKNDCYSEAIRILLNYSESGNGFAMGRLARAYRSGIGVSKDDGKARLWYQRAVDNGILWAQKELDDMGDFE